MCRNSGALLGPFPSTASPPSLEGCPQPAYVGLGTEKSVGASVLGMSKERLVWGHHYTSKD